MSSISREGEPAEAKFAGTGPVDGTGAAAGGRTEGGVPAPIARGARGALAAALSGFVVGAITLGSMLVWQNHRWQERIERQTAASEEQGRRDGALERRIAELEREAAARPALQETPPEALLDPQLRARRAALALIDAERMVELVQVQLRLGLSSGAAVGALSAVDAHLGRVDTPAAARAQRALRDDLARLRLLSGADVGAVAGQLDPLLQEVDSWRVLSDTTRSALDLPVSPPAAADFRMPIATKPGATPSAAGPSPGPVVRAEEGRSGGGNGSRGTNGAKTAGAADAGWGGRFRSWLADEFGDLVRIQRVGTPEAVQLDPAQQRILRDRVRLEILDLQQAILSQEGGRVRSRERALEFLLQRYFDPRDPAVANALMRIRTAADAAAAAEPPSLNETLTALQAAIRAGGH